MKGSLMTVDNKSTKPKERNSTPLNQLLLTQENENTSGISFSNIFHSNSPKPKIKKRVISYSLGNRNNSIHSNNNNNINNAYIKKLLSTNNNNYIIPKKNQTSYLRNYSGSIRKKFISSSRNNKKKKIQRRKVPLFKQTATSQSDYLLTFNNYNHEYEHNQDHDHDHDRSLHTNKSNETINTNQSINLTSKSKLQTSTNNYNFNHDYSFGLSKSQKEKLKEIKKSIIELISIGDIKSIILNDLNYFLHHIANSDTSSSTNHCNHSNYHSHSYNDDIDNNAKSESYRVKENKSRSKHQHNDHYQYYKDSDNDHLLTKINNIDKKFELMQLENSKLKHLITEKTGSFEEVKNSIKTFKNEIDKMKKKNRSNTNKSNHNKTRNYSLNNPNMQNTKIKLVNRAKLPMKNVSINLQLIQKVTGTEGFKHMNFNNDKERKRSKDKDRSKERNKDKDKDIGKDLNKDKEKNNQTIINLQHSTELMPEKLTMLNFEKLPKKVYDFNDEFLQNVDDFSPSWRRDVDKMLQRQKHY